MARINVVYSNRENNEVRELSFAIYSKMYVLNICVRAATTFSVNSRNLPHIAPEHNRFQIKIVFDLNKYNTTEAKQFQSGTHTRDGVETENIGKHKHIFRRVLMDAKYE